MMEICSHHVEECLEVREW